MSSLDMIAAADSTNMKAGGKSFFEDPGAALLGGVGGAVISGLGSIYNTAASASNAVFGTTLDKIDTGAVLNSLDADASTYYQQNKDFIDTAGFIAASFIPGGLAVKGLKLAREGQMFGSFGRALGIASTRQSNYLQMALKEVAEEGGSVFTRISTKKAASMAWGAADQVLQAAVFETAVAITMKQAPMLEGKDITDLGWDIMKTSLAGGAIGGGIEALFTNRIVKNAAKLVDKTKRQHDVLRLYGYLNVTLGDRAFSIVDAMFDVPREALVKDIPFAAAKDGVLRTGNLFAKTADKTVDHALLQFEKTIATAVPNDPSVGTALAKSFMGIYKEGIDKGLDNNTIRQVLGTHLFNLESVHAIGPKAVLPNFEKEIVWFNPRAKLTELSGAKPLMTSAPITNGTPYRVIGDMDLAKVSTLGKTGLMKIEDAFAQGFDAVINPTTKTLHINPSSQILHEITPTEALATNKFFNTVTKTSSDTVVPTVADVVPHSGKLVYNSSVVQAGEKVYRPSMTNYVAPKDSVEATAHHLWAGQQTRVDGNIGSDNISILDRLLENPAAANQSLTLTKPNGATVAFTDITDYATFVFENKVGKLKEFFEEQSARAFKANEGAAAEEALKGAVAPNFAKHADADIRDIAYKFNMTPDFVEKAIATGFDPQALKRVEGWTRKLDSYADRENIIMQYNTQGMENATHVATGLVAHHERMKVALQAVKNASDAVLGPKFSQRFLDLAESITKETDETGVGSGFISSSNANYFDKAAVWSQDTGKNLHLTTQEHLNEILPTLQTPANKVLKNNKAIADLVSLTTKIRTSTEGLALHTDPVSGKSMIVDLASYKYLGTANFKGFATRIEIEDDAAAFLTSFKDLHGERISKDKVMAAAQGVENKWDPDRLYVPPIDTRKVPYFAFVRHQEGKVFGTSETAMITAKDANELRQKAAQIEKEFGFKVLFKSDVEDYHRAKADYDYARAMNNPTIDPALRKAGLLGDFLPSYNGESIIEEFLQYTQRQETRVMRDAVSLRYAQTIAELESLSKRATAIQTSQFSGAPKFLQTKTIDPFGDYLKVAMNISKRSEFTLWHQANEFVDALGTRAFDGVHKAFGDAKDGKITWQEANANMEKFGIGSHFKDPDMFATAYSAQDRNIIKIAFQKANMLLANGMLRLDFANSLLNIVSTPIMLGTEVSAIRKSLKNDPEMFARFNTGLQIADPGNPGVSVPSTMKLMSAALKNSFGESGKQLRERYSAIGALKDVKSIYHEMIDDLALLPTVVPSKFAENVDKWVEKGASLTFNNQAEDLTRFVSANVMHQITQPLVDAGKMGIKEQNAFISIFVNRVQGNYIASQRPILFQGTLGGAIGLFQTYQFNLYQQLFRHIQDKNVRTIATMGGLQASVFGLNGLPLFDAINTHLIGGANINPKHKDMYQLAVEGAGKEWGDWMMYGTVSAMPLFSDKAPALYTRGDLNPRSLTIVPVMPQDVPSVAAASKIVGTLVQMGSQISNGGSLGGALLHGLEHNGINRPLAGLAQTLSGRSTTSKGDLIAANNDLLSITTAARIIGSRPMDESIALNTVYRNKAYDAMDKARVEVVGAAVKDKLRNKQQLSEEDWIGFQGEYIAAGGRLEGYASALQRWDRNANTSIVNEAARHHRTASGQRLLSVMGGDLPDFNNTGVTE